MKPEVGCFEKFHKINKHVARQTNKKERRLKLPKAEMKVGPLLPIRQNIF